MFPSRRLTRLTTWVLLVSVTATAVLAGESHVQRAVALLDSNDVIVERRAAYSTASAMKKFKTTDVAMQAGARLASHSWEYGAMSEALLEVYNPELSVFSKKAFPSGQLPIVTSPNDVYGLSFAKPHVSISGNTLADGDGSSGDPASLGVVALLLGSSSAASQKNAVKTKKGKRAATNSSATAFHSAAIRQLHTLLNLTPRYSNGAISQRSNVAELWADGMFMIPPFLAYAAVATQNKTLMREAVRQCGLYRDVLIYSSTGYKRDVVERRMHRKRSLDHGLSFEEVARLAARRSASTAPTGLWQHIIGPEAQTRGLWATGNGWAALGMVRVLATLTHWSVSSSWEDEKTELKGWLHEIFTALTKVQTNTNGFWRNYLAGGVNSPTDDSVNWFGDSAGSAALVAAALRLAVLDPSTASTLLKTTATPRRALTMAMARANTNQTLGSTVDPLDWYKTAPIYSGSPEGQAFLGMAVAAWRDCVRSGVCTSSEF